MKINSTSLVSQTFVKIFLVTLVLASGTVAVAQSDTDASRGHKVCSNRTLLGDYGTKIEGTMGGTNITLRTLVLAHYDGEGHISSVDYVVRDGVPPPPEEEWRPGTGVYTVNPDCTGSAKVDVAPGFPPLGYHFIVVNNGREILLVVDGGAISGVASKVH
jgi:hypothetical protein